MADAVLFAGGWLFDQVMAGWDVTVLTPGHPETAVPSGPGCCAIRGRPVAAALADATSWDIWECSHLGGHRFAARRPAAPRPRRPA